jgi:hypothetical protein
VLTDVSKLPVLKDQEIVFETECLQFSDQGIVEVLDDIDVRLRSDNGHVNTKLIDGAVPL